LTWCLCKESEIKERGDRMEREGEREGSMGEWENGRMGEWENGRMGEWENRRGMYGRMREWENASDPKR
jgi:hypothetical protein